MTVMREYIVNRGGVDLTVQLSDEDAKRLKARPANEAPIADSPEDDAKVKAPANKARAPRNK